jgi:hypothetical protein
VTALSAESGLASSTLIVSSDLSLSSLSSVVPMEAMGGGSEEEEAIMVERSAFLKEKCEAMQKMSGPSDRTDGQTRWLRAHNLEKKISSSRDHGDAEVAGHCCVVVEVLAV